MLILHDSDGTILGLQTFPKESHQPHIVVDGALFTTLDRARQAGAKLLNTPDGFKIPDDFDTLYSDAAYNLQLAKKVKLKQIDDNLLSQLEAGVLFQFGSTEDLVQTRNEVDLNNIRNCVLLAMIINSPSSIIPFRAGSNTVYELTSKQMLLLGDVVFSSISDMHTKAWKLKDEIKAATSISELDGINW